VCAFVSQEELEKAGKSHMAELYNAEGDGVISEVEFINFMCLMIDANKQGQTIWQLVNALKMARRWKEIVNKRPRSIADLIAKKIENKKLVQKSALVAYYTGVERLTEEQLKMILYDPLEKIECTLGVPMNQRGRSFSIGDTGAGAASPRGSASIGVHQGDSTDEQQQQQQPGVKSGRVDTVAVSQSDGVHKGVHVDIDTGIGATSSGDGAIQEMVQGRIVI
jgi:hypothetical protein